MKRFKAFFAVIFLVIFLTSIGMVSGALYPTSVDAISIPIPSLPSLTIPPVISFPPLIPFGVNWTRLDTDDGDGNVVLPVGLDSNNDLTIAVAGFRWGGSNIYFYNGSEWRKTSNNYYISKLEWADSFQSSYLYATGNESDKVLVCSNPTADAPVWEEIGSSGSAIGEFSNPNGMHFSTVNGLFVADTDNHRIQLRKNGSWQVYAEFDSSSEIIDVVSVSEMFGSTIYATDKANNCIWVKSSILGSWSAITDSQYLISPTCIDADSEGNIYVLSNVANADPDTRCILKYEDGSFSPVVISGDELGEINPSSNSVEEFTINSHDKIIYADVTDSRIIKQSSTDHSLESVTINGELSAITTGQTELNLSFTPDTEEAALVATPSCPYTVINGNQTYPLAYGLNELSVTCTSEDGFSSILNINITRELSDNALLADITIDSVSLSSFNPSIFAYTDITVPYSTETIDLLATSQDENATIVGFGTHTLNVGSNQLLLYVTAQDGVSTEQYLLVIEREEAPATPTPSPSSSPTPTATPTATPSPTATPTATPSSTATPTTSPSATPAPTTSPTAAPTSTPAATNSAEPTVSPEPTNEPEASQTPAPSETAEPAETKTDAPTEDNEQDSNSEDNTKEPNPLLPVIYILAGVILIGGGVFAGIMISKKGKK